MMETAEKIFILRMGHISMPERWIRVGGPDRLATIPVLAFLIPSGDQLVLVDAGCAPAVATEPERAWGKLANLYHADVQPENLLDAQVRAAGYKPHEITDVVVTHLHMDHVGGLEMVRHANVWLQRAEYRWGHCPDDYAAGGYFKNEYDYPDLNLKLLDGDARVAAGVQVMSTVGHTPGHQSVLVRLDSGFFCIVGDAVYNRKSLSRRSQPAVAWDTGRYMESLSRLQSLEDFFGAELLFAHDSDQAEILPQSPNFIG